MTPSKGTVSLMGRSPSIEAFREACDDPHRTRVTDDSAPLLPEGESLVNVADSDRIGAPMEQRRKR